jgi:hypothetical protein
MLFANGVSGTPTQTALNAFTTATNNALSTAAFQLGSGLSLFPQSSMPTIIQLRSALFGPGSTTGTTNFSSLAAALQGLPFGNSTFNTAVSTAFGNALQGLVSPLSTFFGTTIPTNLILPTTGLTNPFGATFTSSLFNSGFNNGFATGTNTGFIGFGVAPTTFNTNFGTGFNNLVSTVNQNMSFVPTIPLSSLGTLGTLGTVGTGLTVTGATGTTGTGITGTGTTGTGTTGTGTTTTGPGLGTGIGVVAVTI